MKRKPLLVVAFIILCFNTLFGQLSKTVDVSMAGTLSTLLTSYEKSNVTDLTISGALDATDLSFIRTQMSSLLNIDLSAANVEGNRIPDLAFMWMTNLKSVILPATLTAIGQAGFLLCTGLTSITFPPSLTTIEASAFLGCDNITSFTVPSSVISIGFSAFSSANLTAVNVDEANLNYCSVEGVWFNKNKTELILYPSGKADKNYIIPSTVTSVMGQAFSFCKYLTSLSVPSSTIDLGGAICYSCDSMTAFLVDNANPNYSGMNGVLFNKDQSALIRYPSNNENVSYSIPETVDTIKGYAFTNSFKIYSLILPADLSIIEKNGFQYCRNLSAIDIPSSVKSIGQGALTYCINLKSLKLPVGLDSIPVDVFHGCTSLTSVTLPSSVSFMSYTNLSTCTSLDTIKLNASVPIIVESGYHQPHDFDTSNCVLYVPAGSLEAYSNAPLWSSFDHIVEFDFSLSLSDNALLLEATEGSNCLFTIHSNTDWMITADKPWIHPNQSRGMDDGSIVLTADANPGADTRQATVTVSGTGIDPSDIVVTQEAGATGLNEINDSKITVFLNSSHEELNIKGASESLLNVFDLQGKILISKSLDKTIETIDVHTLPDGIYLVKIGTCTVKIRL